MRSEEGVYECQINIGICYKNLKRYSKAIEIFLKALQKLIETHNEFSLDAADLYEYLAITYMEDYNFIEGIKYLESAYLIRNKDPQNQKSKDLNKLLVFFFDYFEKYQEDKTLEVDKPELYKCLKENIFNLKKEFGDEEVVVTKKDENGEKGIEMQRELIEENQERIKDATNIEEMVQGYTNIAVLGALTTKEEMMTQMGEADIYSRKMVLP